MAIKNFGGLVQKNLDAKVTPEKMPAGRYGFTVTGVVLSNTDNDFAIYVNLRVRNDSVRNDINVRIVPGLDSSSNWASTYSIINLLDTAKPDSGDRFEDMAADCIDALSESDEAEVESIAQSMQAYVGAIIGGVNFTGDFTWSYSETTKRSYMNLRTSNKDKKVTLSLDHVRETVEGEDLPEQERQPKPAKRNLVSKR